MPTEELSPKDSSVVFETVFTNALKAPGVKVSRKVFLTEQFSGKDQETYQKILQDGPVEAGCSRSELDAMASKLITQRAVVSTGMSFMAGLPGGIAMAATIPADTLQFFGMALRLAQEISYLYGGEDLWEGGNLDDERVQSQLILYCGVMFGVSGSSAAVKAISSAVSKQVIKKLPQKALTKTLYYPVVKKVAALLEVKMTKDTFAKGVAKAVPVVGGVISGGITFASMRPMGRRLAITLSEAHFEYTEQEAERDIEYLYQESKAQRQKDMTEEERTLPKTVVEKREETGGDQIADTLLKYQKLLEAELISRDEFEILKKKLIADNL